MNTNTPSSRLVHLAYRLLKRDTYYDKMDLFLRANVAAYEADNSFQKRQYTLAMIVDELGKGTLNQKSEGDMKKEFEERHVLFQQEDNGMYIEKMLRMAVT